MMDMVAVGERHGIKFPRDFALLFKQMLISIVLCVLHLYTDIYADQRLKKWFKYGTCFVVKALR